MKKYLKIITISSSIFLFFFLGYQVFAKITIKSKVEKKLQTIPDFSFLTLENNVFSNKELEKEKPAIFIYFNSECDYCQYEATIIQENIHQFDNIQILFVSFEDKEAIHTFSKQFELHIYDNVTFLSDTKGDFSERFGATSVPYLLIYDKKQKLVKKHKGLLNIGTILKAIKQINTREGATGELICE